MTHNRSNENVSPHTLTVLDSDAVVKSQPPAVRVVATCSRGCPAPGLAYLRGDEVDVGAHGADPVHHR
jgi:hypothetical protein